MARALQRPGLSDLACSGMTDMGLQVPRNVRGPRLKKRPAPSPHATNAEPMSARTGSLGVISSVNGCDSWIARQRRDKREVLHPW